MRTGRQSLPVSIVNIFFTASHSSARIHFKSRLMPKKDEGVVNELNMGCGDTLLETWHPKVVDCWVIDVINNKGQVSVNLPSNWVNKILQIFCCLLDFTSTTSSWNSFKNRSILLFHTLLLHNQLCKWSAWLHHLEICLEIPEIFSGIARPSQSHINHHMHRFRCDFSQVYTKLSHPTTPKRYGESVFETSTRKHRHLLPQFISKSLIWRSFGAANNGKQLEFPHKTKGGG